MDKEVEELEKMMKSQGEKNLPPKMKEQLDEWKNKLTELKNKRAERERIKSINPAGFKGEF